MDQVVTSPQIRAGKFIENFNLSFGLNIAFSDPQCLLQTYRQNFSGRSGQAFITVTLMVIK